MIPLAAGEIKEDHMFAELGEVVNGSKPGRSNAEEITLFKSNGLAIQDTATAKLVYDKAVAAGIGQHVDL
jgi:ornithine cyclodeaminase/alanine dehydrogenase-like protein (mu-crystallin family)